MLSAESNANAIRAARFAFLDWTRGSRNLRREAPGCETAPLPFLLDEVCPASTTPGNEFLIREKDLLKNLSAGTLHRLDLFFRVMQAVLHDCGADASPHQDLVRIHRSLMESELQGIVNVKRLDIEPVIARNMLSVARLVAGSSCLGPVNHEIESLQARLDRYLVVQNTSELETIRPRTSVTALALVLDEGCLGGTIRISAGEGNDREQRSFHPRIQPDDCQGFGPCHAPHVHMHMQATGLVHLRLEELERIADLRNLRHEVFAARRRCDDFHGIAIGNADASVRADASAMEASDILERFVGNCVAPTNWFDSAFDFDTHISWVANRRLVVEVGDNGRVRNRDPALAAAIAALTSALSSCVEMPFADWLLAPTV